MAVHGADEDFIRVGAGASAEKVAGVVAGAIQAGKEPTLRAVGATAVNQMVKACAIARGYVASQGKDLLFRPGFATIPDRDDPEKEITCIVMKVIVT